MTNRDAAKKLRARIVALGQDIATFPVYLSGAELDRAIMAGKVALAKAEAELTDLLMKDGAK